MRTRGRLGIQRRCLVRERSTRTPMVGFEPICVW